MYKLNKNSQARILVSILIITLSSLVFVSANLFDDIGNILGGEKEVSKESQFLAHNSPNSDLYKTSQGFKSVIFSGIVNIPIKEGKFIAFEDYLNVSFDSGKIKLKTLSGEECYLELDYEAKDELSSKKSTATINKGRGYWYFETDAKEEVNSMNYKVNCKDVSFSKDELLIEDYKIDFSQAKEQQNISTTWNEKDKTLEFKIEEGKTGDLSKIDPMITYNFSTDFAGISSFAYSCANANTTSPPPSGTLYSCNNALTALTASQLALSENTRATTQPANTDNNTYHLFAFNLSNVISNKSDVTSLNFSWEGSELNALSGTIYGYWYNSTSSLWFGMFTTPSSTTDAIKQNLTTSTQDFINASNYFHSLIYWDSHTTGTTLRSDYVFLEITYDDLIVNTPTSNQEILNNLSTILNTSQVGYNQTLWYTWNLGLKNYTLCNDTNECSKVITFPRQGYYNLTVYGNKSDANIISRTVSNLFVGIYTTSSLRDFNTIYGVNASNCSRVSLLQAHDPPTCLVTINSITANPALDYPDSSTVYSNSLSSGDAYFYFKINVSDILTPINNITVRVTANNSNVGEPNNILYMYNQTNATWMTINYTSGIPLKNYSTILSAIKDYNTDGYFRTVWLADSSSANGGASVDYMSININYFSYNNIAPIITNTLVNNSNFSISNVNFTYNISDDNDYLLNISLFLDDTLNMTLTNPTINVSRNNSFSFNITGISDGTHGWFIRAFDSDGVISNSSNFTFTIDTTKPLIVIDYPTNNTNSTLYDLGVNYTVTDTHLSSCWWTDDNGVTNTTSNCLNLTGAWNTGRNTLILYVNDTFGHTNQSGISFFIDPSPPSLSIIKPVNGEGFTTGTIELNYTVGDSGVGLSSCWYKNNSDNINITITCGTNTTISNIEGTHTVYMWANDTLNNVASTQAVWTISTDAPAMSLIYPNNNQWFNNGTARYFNFTAVDGNGIDTCDFYLNATGQTWNLNQTKKFAGDLSVSESEGFFILNLTDNLYTWNVKCNDSATPNKFSFAVLNRTFGVDTTYPQINLTYPENITYTTNLMYLNFTASDLNRDSCWYSINGTTNITLTSCLNTTFTANQGNSILNIFVNDSANNLNYTSVEFFVDSILPSVTISTTFSNGSYLNYNTSIKINLTISDTNINSCWYNLDSGSNQYFACGTNLSLSTTDEALHTVSISANDSLNNINNSEKISFYSDTILPIVNISSLVTVLDSQTFTFDLNVSDFNISNCFFTIYNRSGSPDTVYPANSSINCNSIGNSKTVSDWGTWNLEAYGNDSAGNKGKINQSFTVSQSVSPPAPTGGNPSTTITIQYPTTLLSFLSQNFSVGEPKMDISLAKNSVKSRKKSFYVSNSARQATTITLECDLTDVNKSSKDINICDYVKFPNGTITLSPNEQERTLIEFELYPPENASYGDKFFFNVLVVNYISENVSYYSKLSVSSKISVLATIFSKWSYLSKSRNILYPVFPVSLLLSLIISVVVFLILSKGFKLFLTGLFLAVSLFIASFILFSLFVL